MPKYTQNPPPDETADVVIIGAGVAGLAAASSLREQGIRATILEARDRIGGRILTRHPSTLAVPVELGAEFTHGDTSEVDEIAKSGGHLSVDISGRRYSSTAGRLRPLNDFWKRIDRVMRPLSAEREPDRSFAEALARRRSIPPADRALAIQFIEGFHAADPKLVSERALAEGGSPQGDVREKRIGRVLGGYGQVVDALAAPVLDSVRSGAVVRAVCWKQGRVEVEWHDHGGTMARVIVARAVVVAVPLGVLAAAPDAQGFIRFEPSIPQVTRAIGGMAMGTVVRVSLELDTPFWMEQAFARRAGDDRLDVLSFLHASSRVPFPVWWTQYPVRAPLLVAWRGGPGAVEISRGTRDEVVALAVRSMAKVFGITERKARGHVRAAHMHDWTSDPFARGAYSYVRTGGAGAGAALARPVRGTVFFAGEHADGEGRNGTVHGAIASGRRAAVAVVRALQSR